MIRLPTIVITLSIVLGALPAVADNVDEEAKIQFKQGVTLYKDGDFEQAAIAFERAYELKPSYRILFNIAQTENERKHYAAALKAYHRYLKDGGDQIEAERRAEVEKEFTRLKALVGGITVKTDIKGAVVFVDGFRHAETPFTKPILVDLGEHEVLIKQGTEELHRETIKVAGGQKVVVDLDAGASEVASAPIDGPAEPDKEERDSPKRVWTWVALGVGGAAAVGAGITGGLTLGKAGDIEDDCGGTECPSSQKSAVDDAKTLGNVTNVLIGVAAVGIAAGIVLFFVEPGLGGEKDTAVVTPVAMSNGGGIVVSGSF
jgi:hypothetical protein